MKRKIEKGKYLIFAALFLSMIYAVQFVSAASIVDDFNGFLNGVVEVLNPFSAMLLGDTQTGDMLFAKVLFFVIVLSMVWLALSRIPFFNPEEGAQLWVIWVVAIAISILAVRFIGDAEWIQTIILPYSTLGIVLAAGFPFVIYFILIDVMLAGPGYKTVRKVAWVFFAVVFMGLFVARGDLTGGGRNIYLVTAVLSFIVILMDGTFQRMLHDMRLDRFSSRDPARQLVLEQMVRNDSLLANGMISPGEHQRTRKKLVKELQTLNK